MASEKSFFFRQVNATDHLRRKFIRKGILIGTAAGIGGTGMILGCRENVVEEITPAEDLMREHGVLNRIMLVYDTCNIRIRNREAFPLEALNGAAMLIRTFIEDYHENLEERFVFPLFTNATRKVDLVQLLYIQHHAGRVLTDQILELTRTSSLDYDSDGQKIILLLDSFNRMYRAHESREDTVLFPEIRELISNSEYRSMGEDFEKREKELLGADGFESTVEKVAVIEKQLGIYDMSLFTPAV
jgi:hemerythrin-like domain-containing protein